MERVSFTVPDKWITLSVKLFIKEWVLFIKCDEAVCFVSWRVGPTVAERSSFCGSHTPQTETAARAIGQKPPISAKPLADVLLSLRKARSGVHTLRPTEAAVAGVVWRARGRGPNFRPWRRRLVPYIRWSALQILAGACRTSGGRGRRGGGAANSPRSTSRLGEAAPAEIPWDDDASSRGRRGPRSSVHPG